MMFQNLRENSEVYILHKDGNPYIEHGIVTEMKSRPEYVMPTQPGQFPRMETMIDVTLNIGGDNVHVTGLPANLEITDKVIDGKKIVVSASRELMNNEVSLMRQRSVDIVKSVDFNKNIIHCCDKMLNILNPEIAERQRKEEELKSLKEQMGDMMRNMSTIAEQNRRLMELLGVTETPQKQ